VIETLLNKCDKRKLLLGGGMIFTFYKSSISVDKSLVEEDK